MDKAPEKRTHAKILNPPGMLVLGLLSGAVSRLLDIYTVNLGEIFSQMAVWILIGTVISIYSSSKGRAMANILAFCLGMLAAYYAAAVITDGVYGRTFIIGWTLFALCSPILAYFTWMTKERGLIPKLIGTAIVAVSVLSGVILFDGPRIYDLIIDGALVWLLFFSRVRR